MPQELTDIEAIESLDFAPRCTWRFGDVQCERVAAWVSTLTCCGDKGLACEEDRVYWATLPVSTARCPHCGVRHPDHRMSITFTTLDPS